MAVFGAAVFLAVAPAAAGSYAGADPAQPGGDPVPTIAGVGVENADPSAPAMVSVASRQAGTGTLAAVGLVAVTSLSLFAGGWMLWRRCATPASEAPPGSR